MMIVLDIDISEIIKDISTDNRLKNGKFYRNCILSKETTFDGILSLELINKVLLYLNKEKQKKGIGFESNDNLVFDSYEYIMFCYENEYLLIKISKNQKLNYYIIYSVSKYRINEFYANLENVYFDRIAEMLFNTFYNDVSNDYQKLLVNNLWQKKSCDLTIETKNHS